MSSTLMNVLLIAIPLVVALTIYRVLRDRDQSVAGATCLSAAVGLLLLAIWMGYSIFRVL